MIKMLLKYKLTMYTFCLKMLKNNVIDFYDIGFMYMYIFVKY